MKPHKISTHSSKRSAVPAVVWAISVLALAAVPGFSAATAAATAYVPWPAAPGYAGIALYLLEACVCIVIHEFGHVVAAKSVGWHVRSIAVGPFAYMSAERRIVIVKRRASQWLSGLVTAAPPIADRRDARGRMIFVLGGPAANIVFGMATFPFVPALKEPWDPANLTAVIFGSLSIVSLTMGISNLVPFYLQDMKSDGLRLLDMFVHKFTRNRTSAQFDAYRRFR